MSECLVSYLSGFSTYWTVVERASSSIPTLKISSLASATSAKTSSLLEDKKRRISWLNCNPRHLLDPQQLLALPIFHNSLSPHSDIRCGNFSRCAAAADTNAMTCRHNQRLGSPDLQVFLIMALCQARGSLMWPLFIRQRLSRHLLTRRLTQLNNPSKVRLYCGRIASESRRANTGCAMIQVNTSIMAIGSNLMDPCHPPSSL